MKIKMLVYSRIYFFFFFSKSMQKNKRRERERKLYEEKKLENVHVLYMQGKYVEDVE